jgi:predicted esterase
VACLALGAAGMALGCDLGSAPELPEPGSVRLRARPGTGSALPESGLSRLFLDEGRDAFLYVPEGLPESESVPLVLLLHGAGGSGDGIITPLRPYADAAGCVLVAPGSRGATWDAIRGSFGADVAFIDAALVAAFARCRVDAVRVGIAGFSDGATYALAIGRANGDLLRRIVAFSPGFLIAVPPVDQPPVYITHGVFDTVLPIDQTSVVIAGQLTSAGYSVTFRPFDGGHHIPAAFATEAMRWVSGGDLDPSGT